MRGMPDFMSDMMGGGSDDGDWKALDQKEIKKIGGFQPVPNLVPGDILKPRAFNNNSKLPDANKTVTVFRVGNFAAPREAGCPVRDDDFTTLVHVGKDILECAEDSRQWERA